MTFSIWPLVCVLVADELTATILRNSRLESLSISSIPPHTAFPFMTNEPKNQIEWNWVPLLDAVYTTESASQQGLEPTGSFSWLETGLQRLLLQRPSITTLGGDLASIGSFAYGLLIQRWWIRYARGDTTLASTRMPQNAVAAGLVMLRFGLVRFCT